jgi:hypothetical protein
VDFDADSCLIIHDPAAFAKRLHSSMQICVPGYRFVQREVDYYDPLNVSELQVDVLTWKNFRYAYQCEMRLAWVPPTPVQQLPEIDLVLGNLGDIAELIVF